jgi:ATP-dependent Clp protease ATP-binding subunit ClpX
LQFTKGALRAVADVGLKRGGGARGLRGVLEEVLGDAMFEVPGSVCLSFQVRNRDADDQSVRYCLITEGTVQGTDPARYYSRGQKHVFHNELEHQNRQSEPVAASIEEMETEIEDEGLRATG